MTNLTIPVTLPMTPLTELLQKTAVAAQLAVYRGVQTVQQFGGLGGLDSLDEPDSPKADTMLKAETKALATAATVCDLGWLCRVAVRGEDRFRWLSGMVTNTVQDLKAGSGTWNLVLNAQGRIQGDLHVWRMAPSPTGQTAPHGLLSESKASGEQDELELEIAADQKEKLLAHLDHFIIMDDVELIPGTGMQALGLSGPLAGEVLGHLGIAPLAEMLTQKTAVWQNHSLLIRRGYSVLVPHYSLWVPTSALAELWQALQSAGAIPVGSAAMDALRIADGIPAYGIDMVERYLPQETSQMRTLNFSKGCYLGQEIVERIRSRGNVHRHLRQLELTGALPTPGTELMLNDTVVGSLTSIAEFAARTWALGMVRATVEIGAQTLHYPGNSPSGTAQIISTPSPLNTSPISS